MNITAKMRCHSVTKGDGYETINLGAVCDDSPENKTFSTATPSANLSMTISNPAAFGAFVERQEYYVNFTPWKRSHRTPRPPSRPSPNLRVTAK